MDDLSKRFWSKVARNGRDDCWLWTGAKSPKHYGVLVIQGKPRGAHRVSWCLDHGKNVMELPTSVQIMHKCDTPSCVNPRHLIKGDAIKNNKDTTRKMRRAFGERNPSSKLTNEAIAYIRATATTWDGMCDAMKKYRVSQSTIRSVLRSKTWRHVKG